MNNEQILVKLKEFKKGTYVNLVKTKTYKKGVVKITAMVMRLGVDYSHMKANLDKVCGPLPYGKWLENFEGFVITHNNNLYLRIATTYVHKSDSKYYYNGNEITKEEAIAIEGASQFKSSTSDVYNIKFENIVQLG